MNGSVTWLPKPQGGLGSNASDALAGLPYVAMFGKTSLEHEHDRAHHFRMGNTVTVRKSPDIGMDLAQEGQRAIFQPCWHVQGNVVTNDIQPDCSIPALTLRWPIDKRLVKGAHLPLDINRGLQSRLDELYFDQGMPLRLVQEIGWRLYQFWAP